LGSDQGYSASLAHRIVPVRLLIAHPDPAEFSPPKVDKRLAVKLGTVFRPARTIDVDGPGIFSNRGIILPHWCRRDRVIGTGAFIR
jgi:hypothetical protein